MDTKNYLKICSQSIQKVCKALNDLEEVLYDDPDVVKRLVALSPQSIQSIDQSQQELAFLSSLLEELSNCNTLEASVNLDAFLTTSNLKSMSSQFLSVK